MHRTIFIVTSARHELGSATIQFIVWIDAATMVLPIRRAKARSTFDSDAHSADVLLLNQRIKDEAPARGYAPSLHQTVAFRVLPVSDLTIRGLDEAKPPYTIMTDIQNACIPHALVGRDILGAARTGSGKTLAFVIPILEMLYRHQFTPMDGPGAVVLSPTRELGTQIFQVLRAVGKRHCFSIGLLIGGTKFYEEQQQLRSTNIIIATPGRLLQHLEQTPYFEISQVKVLVLDEADRILDMGFRDQLVRVLDYFPMNRQTLLFSATQTRNIKQLATLSLNQPEYVGVHDKEKTTTPDALQQSYVIVPLEHKLDAAYSFLKSHLKTKSILFMNSCAQVKHAWEMFCALRPGIPVMALHGKLPQEKRTRIYLDFSQRPHAVLFATDIAARGLDFKNVDWVVQIDAPEDRDMYIHRVGRTARYRAGGKSLLMLTDAEEDNGFVKLLQKKSLPSIPLRRLKINPSKTVVVTERAASLLASNAKLHDLAKKAFSSYVRSIKLMPHTTIFQVQDLDLDSYAKSLGLASTPSTESPESTPVDRASLRRTKNVNRKLEKLKDQIKAEKLVRRKQHGLNERTREALPESSDSEDEVLVSKLQSSNWADLNIGDAGLSTLKGERPINNRKIKIRIEATQTGANRIIFNDNDAEPMGVAACLEPAYTTANQDVVTDKTKFLIASKGYTEKVRKRLLMSSTRDGDEEADRIHRKHKRAWKGHAGHR